MLICYGVAKTVGNALQQGPQNVFRRVTDNIIDVVPPFLFMYGVYSWVTNTHTEMHRKKPSDFADE